MSFGIMANEIPAEVVLSEAIAAIISAFAGVQRENGMSLHEADVLDMYGSPAECAAARKMDSDQSWEEVPSADIARFYSVLSFFDPKGFRYYLPAYMIWSLRNYETSASPSADATIFALTFSGDHKYERYHRERFELLTKDQARAVCRFLQYLIEYGGEDYSEAAQRAFDSYWKQFV